MLNQENLGACSHDKVLVAQTFGRDAGFICAGARLADVDRKLPLILLLPEDQQSIEKVMGAVENSLSRFGRAVVVLVEGYDLGDVGENLDPSGQVMYSSSRTTALQLFINQCLTAYNIHYVKLQNSIFLRKYRAFSYTQNSGIE